MSKSKAEEKLAMHLRVLDLSVPEREFRFDDVRMWRFDFAWPGCKLAVEVEGFGHHKLNRFFADIEKYNAAALDGWRVLRYTPKMVEDGVAFRDIEKVLKQSEEEEDGDG